MRNLHLTFVLCSASQNEGEDFAKFCGLLRIYELFKYHWFMIKKTKKNIWMQSKKTINTFYYNFLNHVLLNFSSQYYDNLAKVSHVTKTKHPFFSALIGRIC